MRLLLILAVAAMAMRGRVGPAPAPQEGPRLAEPSGAVQFMPPGSDVWLVARSSRSLEVGTRVRTGRDGSARIVLKDGLARLERQSSAKLDGVAAVYLGGGAARYEGLIAGRFPVAYAVPQVPASFDVTVSTGGDTLVRVSSGTVSIKDNGGQEHVLTAASERWFTAASLRKPTPPQEPLEPPAQPLP